MPPGIARRPFLIYAHAMTDLSPDPKTPARYDAAETEKRWRARWKAENVFVASNEGTKPKYYVLEMFPYPSGRFTSVTAATM